MQVVPVMIALLMPLTGIIIDAIGLEHSRMYRLYYCGEELCLLGINRF
jgi:hypothetical protein